LVMCDATLRVDDPAALTQALNDAYHCHDDEPDGTLVWFEHVITHGMQRIRAHLELSGDQLHVHANSTTRFERVLGVPPAFRTADQIGSDPEGMRGIGRKICEIQTRVS